MHDVAQKPSCIATRPPSGVVLPVHFFTRLWRDYFVCIRQQLLRSVQRECDHPAVVSRHRSLTNLSGRQRALSKKIQPERRIALQLRDESRATKDAAGGNCLCPCRYKP